MRAIIRAALLIIIGFVGSACSDSTGFNLQPFLVTDTVDVVAPLPQNAELPTALDVTGDGMGRVWGGRFPELSRDALQWDFLVRIRDGQLVLLPAPAVGLVESSAALTPAIEGETFEGLREAPGQTTFVNDAPVVMQTGRVYVARSRPVAFGFSNACIQFAKFEPLVVDVAAGILRIKIVTNQNCQDLRLVPAD